MQEVLVLDTGGTFSQEQTKTGLKPSSKNWMQFVPEIQQLAKITYYGAREGLQRIDSTEMTTNNRQQLANIITQELANYDGFVVVQGTDSMVESGAAMSYMLQHLNKPVILTGSQIPIFNSTQTDAKRNIYHAVEAATSDLKETAIAFGDVLLRANRAQKINENQYKAFDTPRVTPLATYGINGISNLQPHARITSHNQPYIFTDFDERVGFYWQSSGTQASHLELLVEQENVQGIVLAAFGAGNVQKRHHKTIERAINKYHKPVIITTQCQRGTAEFDLYEVSQGIVEAGAISAQELTPQAATQKLMYALGQAQAQGVAAQNRRDYVQRIIQTDIAGDLETIHEPKKQAIHASASAQQHPYSYA